MFGGFGSGIEFYFISMMALPVVIYQRSRQIFLVQILCVIGLACQKYFARIAPRNADDQSVVMAFYVLNSFYSSFIIILGFTFYRRLNKRNEQELLDNNLLIIEKNKKLEQMNKSLDAFSSSVSHDLRAPVLSIEGFANLIQSQYSEKLGDGKELLDMILKNTETMKTLINDILVYAKSGKAEIKVTEIDLADLTRQIISEFAPIVSQNKTQVVLRPLGNVFADPLLMKMVMSNLISNAVKYSSKSESPFVEIGSMDGGEGKVFYVRDNGVGFDMKHYGKLFSIFKRLHSAADYEGSGVGLATVENIISRHGGKIWAESGNGSTTFFFSLSDGQ
jgi:light-regulated signal transduction histidine kinase (bacteriophytochrome)